MIVYVYLWMFVYFLWHFRVFAVHCSAALHAVVTVYNLKTLLFETTRDLCLTTIVQSDAVWISLIDERACVQNPAVCVLSHHGHRENSGSLFKPSHSSINVKFQPRSQLHGVAAARFPRKRNWKKRVSNMSGLFIEKETHRVCRSPASVDGLLRSRNIGDMGTTLKNSLYFSSEMGWPDF